MRIEKQLPLLAAGLQRIASAANPREACGVIALGGQIVESPNLTLDPIDHFDLGSLDEIEAREGRLLAIWHTHPADEPPSAQDIAGCTATALPWIIAGPTKCWVIHPEKLAYVGREFVYGITDCWQLVSDWFACERSVFLPWFPRPPDGWWEQSGPSPYLEAAHTYGFEVLPISDGGFAALRAGDVLLMKIAARRVNHAAVYIGGGSILHHLYGNLSTVEQLNDRLQGATLSIGRYLT